MSAPLEGDPFNPAQAPKPDVAGWGGSTGWVTDSGGNYGPGMQDPGFQGPKPVGGGGGNDEISADTEAFTTVAANMASLITPLKEVQTQLAAIDVRPGAFAQAFQLKDQVSGGAGLKTSLTAVTNRLIETLTDVQNGLLKMALDYETTEEANKATAESLNAVMPDLGADIQGVLSMRA